MTTLEQSSLDTTTLGTTNSGNNVNTPCVSCCQIDPSFVRDIELQQEKTNLDCNRATSSISIQTNPYPMPPPKYTRYRHPSHHHKLFMAPYRGERNYIHCDNKNCLRNFSTGETVFTCFRCDFDLCEKCFQLASDTEVELAENDKDVNETTIKSLQDNLLVKL